MAKAVKVVGVWMDQKNAHIISSPDKSANDDFEILSNVDCDDHDSDTFKNERVNLSKETQEQKKYFKEIASHIQDSDNIYLFGPGQVQEQFKRFLKDYQNFNKKDIKLGTADKISDNQMIACVKDFFVK
ncbi:MAG: hypothetical protein RLZZ546_1790 [Bacteroidota bacterium]